MLLTLGVVLATGISLPRWMWLSMEAGAVLGIAGVTWLQYETIYQVGYLCPWCMVVWSMMIPIFAVLTTRDTRRRFGSSTAHDCGWRPAEVGCGLSDLISTRIASHVIANTQT